MEYKGRVKEFLKYFRYLWNLMENNSVYFPSIPYYSGLGIIKLTNK